MRAKVYLNPLTHLKVIYLKLSARAKYSFIAQNYHKPNYLLFYLLQLFQNVFTD